MGKMDYESSNFKNSAIDRMSTRFGNGDDDKKGKPTNPQLVPVHTLTKTYDTYRPIGTLTKTYKTYPKTTPKGYSTTKDLSNQARISASIEAQLKPKMSYMPTLKPKSVSVSPEMRTVAPLQVNTTQSTSKKRKK